MEHTIRNTAEDAFAQGRRRRLALVVGVAGLLGAGYVQAQVRTGPAPSPSQAERASAASATQGRGNGSSAADRAIVAQAIAQATVMRGGKAFPAVRAGGRGVSASCELYATQPFTQAAKIDIEGGRRAKKSATFPSGAPQLAVYSPPNTDWVIQSYNRQITTAGSAYTAFDSGMPGGYSGGANINYSSVVSTMDSFVNNLAVLDYIKIDFKAQIDTFVSNVMSYNASMNSSHGAVHHTAQVYGTGIANTTAAHSWYHAHINGTLACSPAYLRDQNALTTHLKNWVNGVVATLPISVKAEDQRMR